MNNSQSKVIYVLNLLGAATINEEHDRVERKAMMFKAELSFWACPNI